MWKLEFQRRGAPPVHLLIVPPHGVCRTIGQSFRLWVSQAWAEIVAHPDPDEYRKHLLAGTGVDFAQGLRSTDPRRVAVYFIKHGSFAEKAYQHRVPEAWQAPATDPGDSGAIGNFGPPGSLSWCACQTGSPRGGCCAAGLAPKAPPRKTTRPRVKRATGRVRYRKTRVWVRRLGGCRGWVSVNDGASLAAAIARFLEDR